MLLIALGTPSLAEEDASEQLIVLVQPEASELAKTFQAKHLPKIEELAKEMGLALIVKDISEGPVPAEVGITPLIVFQNHAGRSIYQGRYATLDRLGNFIVTSRFMPQGDDKLKIKDAVGMRDGRSTVVLPMKVTDLAGAKPDGYDASAFAAGIKRKLEESPMLPSGPLGDVALGRSDRQFYADFYPYRSEDGTLYLSVALFSQFHCHDPVFTTGDAPLQGPWDEQNAVFEKAAGLVNQQVMTQLRESKIGDGFDAVPDDRATATWESLGLELPPKPANAATVDPASLTLGEAWQVDTEAQKRRPAATFGFAAPLDNYSGRVKQLTGDLTLGKGLSLTDAKGKFVVPIKAVTMGDEMLDVEIQGWLSAKRHPEASFVFEKIDTAADQLVFGQVIPGVLVGQFKMKGIAIDLSVPVSIEAIVGTDGKPRVTIDGKWVVDITDPFGVAGPDGPEDVASQLIYQCHIVLKPAAE